MLYIHLTCTRNACIYAPKPPLAVFKRNFTEIPGVSLLILESVFLLKNLKFESTFGRPNHKIFSEEKRHPKSLPERVEWS